MVAWVPLTRAAFKFAPIALELGRQLDRQLRPHVLAYRFARDIDGYVARWSPGKTAHWVVFARPDAAPLRAFPPLPDTEVVVVARELDRGTLRHHTQLPEARVKHGAGSVVTAPGRVAGRLRRGGEATDAGPSDPPALGSPPDPPHPWGPPPDDLRREPGTPPPA